MGLMVERLVEGTGEGTTGEGVHAIDGLRVSDASDLTLYDVLEQLAERIDAEGNGEIVNAATFMVKAQRETQQVNNQRITP